MASAQYEARRNAGLCGQCGAPAQTNMKLMSAVRDRIARESGQTLARVSTMATCQKCGEQRRSNTKREATAKPRRRASKDNHYWKCVEAGMCPSHPSSPARPGKITCDACRIRKHDDSAARRDKWKQDPDCCNQCGKVNDSHRYVLCSKCRGYGRAWQQNTRRAAFDLAPLQPAPPETNQ